MCTGLCERKRHALIMGPTGQIPAGTHMKAVWLCVGGGGSGIGFGGVGVGPHEQHSWGLVPFLKGEDVGECCTTPPPRPHVCLPVGILTGHPPGPGPTPYPEDEYPRDCSLRRAWR